MPLLKFSDIIRYFSVPNVNAVSIIEKGENALKSDHLLKFEVRQNGDIFAIVRRSYVKDKAKAYHLTVKLPAAENELSLSCQCPNGQYRCHHMAAVLLHIKDNVSKTDTECTWTNPYKKPRLVESTVANLHEPYTSKQVDLIELAANSADKENLLRRLNPAEAFSLHWLCIPDNSTPSIQIPINSASFIFTTWDSRALSDEVLVRNALMKTEIEVQEIAEATIGQRFSKRKVWYEHRKYVLTSSNFGKILHQIKINSYPPSFYKALTGGYEAGRSRACKFGIDNEPEAIKKYTEVTGNTVKPTGLHLLPCGFLGGSPDGVVNQSLIIEVKCSYQQYTSSKSFIELASDPKIKDFCLLYSEDGLHLKRNHNFYHQIQGNIFATKSQYCHFFLWSPIEYYLETVEKDEEWKCNLDCLETFYFRKFIPQMVRPSGA